MNTTAVEATEALIQNYSKLIFHVIYGLTGHWEESQDLTQETFLQAFRGIDVARAKAGNAFQPKPWLLKVALNTVRMAHRRKPGFRFISFADLPSEQKSGEQATEGSPAYEKFEDAEELEMVVAERDVVSRCLHQLPGALRTPLLLSIVAGFSSGEIASLLDLKEAAVRQRLTRARKAFQRLYTYESGEHLHIEAMTLRPQVSVSRSRDHLRRRSAILVPALWLG